MDKSRPAGETAKPVNSISDLRFADHDLDAILGHVGQLGVQALPGWENKAQGTVNN